MYYLEHQSSTEGYADLETLVTDGRVEVGARDLDVGLVRFVFRLGGWRRRLAVELYYSVASYVEGDGDVRKVGPGLFTLLMTSLLMFSRALLLASRGWSLSSMLGRVSLISSGLSRLLIGSPYLSR